MHYPKTIFTKIFSSKSIKEKAVGFVFLCYCVQTKRYKNMQFDTKILFLSVQLTYKPKVSLYSLIIIEIQKFFVR